MLHVVHCFAWLSNRFDANKEAYLEKVVADVQEQVPPSSTIIFSEPKPAHDNILRVLYQNIADDDDDDAVNNSVEDSFHSCMQDPEDRIIGILGNADDVSTPRAAANDD